MYKSKESPRVRRSRCLTPEFLEQRMVLSAGQGSTFAIMPGTVSTAGQLSSIPFTINSSLFTPTKDGKLMIGIDVTPATATTSTGSAATTSKVSPEVVSVTSSTGQVIRVQHTPYYPKIAKANHLGKSPSSAVLLTMKVPTTGSDDYTVQVEGLKHTTGQYLLGFYLPGDAKGTGTVNSADISTIKSMLGDSATSSNYSFDADVNRNGIINQPGRAAGREEPRRRDAGQPGGLGQSGPGLGPEPGSDDQLQHRPLRRDDDPWRHGDLRQ